MNPDAVVRNPAEPPPDRGVRRHWGELPYAVRSAFEEWFGTRIVTAVTQPNGFSPGVAARLVGEDGRRVFVKAVHPERNAISPEMHRLEARVVAALPPDVPVPRLLWSYDEGPEGWVLLAL